MLEGNPMEGATDIVDVGLESTEETMSGLSTINEGEAFADEIVAPEQEIALIDSAGNPIAEEEPDILEGEYLPAEVEEILPVATNTEEEVIEGEFEEILKDPIIPEAENSDTLEDENPQTVHTAVNNDAVYSPRNYASQNVNRESVFNTTAMEDISVSSMLDDQEEAERKRREKINQLLAEGKVEEAALLENENKEITQNMDEEQVSITEETSPDNQTAVTEQETPALPQQEVPALPHLPESPQ